MPSVRLRLTVVLLVCLTAVVAAPAHAAPRAPVVQFGFNEWPDAEHHALQTQVGAPVLRMFVGWNHVQPTPDTWNWDLHDGQYAAARAAGLRPLIVAVAAPCWANPADPCSGSTWIVPDSAHDADWAEFTRRLARRYPGAIGIEIWNEPNIGPAFGWSVDPVRYTGLLRTAHGAIKRVSRNMPVISGGLFATPVSGHYGTSDSAFVAAMYAAGAGRYMDGIGVHPYPVAGGWDGTPARYDLAALDDGLARVRTVRDAAGASTPLWVTETGESTGTQDGSPPAATDAQQAEDILGIVRRLRAARDVRVALIHRLVDSPGAQSDYVALEAGFGVYRADGSPKPAACAISRELGGSLSC
jgi:hypothetical protein